MEVYQHTGDQHYPSVHLDPNTGILRLQGISIPANSEEFYGKIISWINEYAKSPQPITEFHFALDYFSTSSTKQVWHVLKALRPIHSQKPGALVLKWFLDEDDEEMKEKGEEFETILGMKFEYIIN